MGEEVEDIVKRLEAKAHYVAAFPNAMHHQIAVPELLAEAADTIESLRASLTRVEEDTARLDWLDRANALLIAKYGTRYKWQVILNHNVARLMLGDMQVDLHDTDPNGLPSCRDAIDAARNTRLSRDVAAQAKVTSTASVSEAKAEDAER
mgnify:CR=1 FL=1